jgi:ATP-dependent Clp protease ATP-binding subunit ClpC
MPKVNVYLPDDLAESVKDTGLPVSAICQRALEQSVKRVGAIRSAVLSDLPGEDPTAGLTSFTLRAKQVLKIGIAGAKERGVAEVGSRDLLRGMIAEGANLALQVLQTLDVATAAVLRELDSLESEPSSGTLRMSSTAANALELAVIEALTLGHNYVGCEHLLLGFVAEPDGSAGQILRGLGIESKQVRQAVSAALAGYVHLRANQAAAGDAATKALEEILRRLDRLEANAGLT